MDYYQSKANRIANTLSQYSQQNVKVKKDSPSQERQNFLPPTIVIDQNIWFFDKSLVSFPLYPYI